MNDDEGGDVDAPDEARARRRAFLRAAAFAGAVALLAGAYIWRAGQAEARGQEACVNMLGAVREVIAERGREAVDLGKLRIQARPYRDFDDEGACQELFLLLGEDVR